MMVLYSGAKLNAVNYRVTVAPDSTGEALKWDHSAWFGSKPALKDMNPLMNLPYIVDGDIVVAQTNACFQYLGRKFNMLGSNEVEQIQCEQLLCEVMDLRNKMVGFAYNAGATKATAESLLKDVTGKNGILQKFELWLAREKAQDRSGTFLVGNRASAPDFHLWEMLHQYSVMAQFYELGGDALGAFPHLMQFRESFAALPGNVRYFTSPLASMPFNNNMASFHATPSGERWTLDTKPTWHEISGEY
jgi:glutathione S-transferase